MFVPRVRFVDSNVCGRSHLCFCLCGWMARFPDALNLQGCIVVNFCDPLIRKPLHILQGKREGARSAAHAAVAVRAAHALGARCCCGLGATHRSHRLLALAATPADDCCECSFVKAVSGLGFELLVVELLQAAQLVSEASVLQV